MPVPSAVISVPISAEPASCRSAPARRSGSCRAAAGSPGTARSRPCLAEPPAESPSTMNSSHSAGSFSWQSASLPGRDVMSSAPLRRVRSRALRAASRAAAASTILLDDALGFVRVLLEPVASASATTISTTGRTSDETSLSLVCAGELRVRHLDRQHAGQAFAHVVAGQVDLLLLGDARLVDVFVDDAGQRRAEAGQVGAAVALRDVVGEAQHRLVVAVVPLHRHFHRDLAAKLARPHRRQGDGGLVQDVLGAVEILDEGLQAALVVQIDLLRLDATALIDKLEIARRNSGRPARAGGAPGWRSRNRPW